MKVRIKTAGATRFYYPDVTVICGEEDTSAVFTDKPVVLVEVLSESTRRVDTTEKREAYLTIPSLSAYLIVDTERPSVTVYRRTGEGAGDTAFAAELYNDLEASIPLETLAIELPLTDVYQRVDFGQR